MKNKIVIIGDIIDSQKFFNPSTWTYFKESINEINNKFFNKMEIGLTIYSGDCFGAVCKNLNGSYDIVNMLFSKFNDNVRIVLIKDEISFGFEQKNFLQLQGPAVWKAEKIMKYLKKEKMYFKAELPNKQISDFLTIAMNLIINIKSGWTNSQKKIVSLYDEGIGQREIAENLNVTQQYISKELIKAKYNLIKKSEIYLRSIWND
jgi:hypothetical protein